MTAAALAVGLTLGLAGTAAASHGPTSTRLYDSTISPLPGNIPSAGPEAYSFNALGNEINLAPSSQRLGNVVLTLSSWACPAGSWTGTPSPCVTPPGATYAVPVTFTISRPGTTAGTVGSVIATKTQTFNIPFRPSAYPTKCSATPTEWFNVADNTCYNGLAHNITFDFSSLHVVLPSTVVYGISFNTDNSGPAPLHGTNSPTDSLNIALTTSSTIRTSTLAIDPSVGADTFPGNLFMNSALATPSIGCNPTTVDTFVGTSVWCSNGEALIDPATGLMTGLYDLPAVQFNTVNS